MPRFSIGRLNVISVLLVLTATRAGGEDYFPPGSLSNSPATHQRKADWYTGFLSVLREPSLWQASKQRPAEDVYRFFWLRTFHHPISVRLTVGSDGTGTLVSKESSGHGGYSPGKLIRNQTVRLAPEKTVWFQKRFAELGVEKLPYELPYDGTITLDGAAWIMEVSKGGKYQIVSRQSPEPRDPIHIFGTILLFDLAHFRLLYQDVY